MFGLNLHWWETVMVGSLAVAAIAAIAVVVSTRVVIILQREALKDSADQFAQYKVDAGLKIAKATEGAANANASAAKANERAETARLETERLKKQLAWREITPQQAEILRTALRKAPMQITVSWVMGDAESSEFTRSLAESIIGSPVEITAFAPMGFMGEEPHGMSVSGSERFEVDKRARIFRES